MGKAMTHRGTSRQGEGWDQGRLHNILQWPQLTMFGPAPYLSIFLFLHSTSIQPSVCPRHLRHRQSLPPTRSRRTTLSPYLLLLRGDYFLRNWIPRKFPPRARVEKRTRGNRQLTPMRMWTPMFSPRRSKVTSSPKKTHFTDLISVSSIDLAFN